jgi:hypothetical protein
LTEERCQSQRPFVSVKLKKWSKKSRQKNSKD